MRRRSLAAIPLMAVVLGGCLVGPRYAPPTPPAPTANTFAAAAPAVSSGQTPPPAWWRLYADPALDQLVQDALTRNRDLLVALANLAEARGALDQARAGLYPSTALSAGAQYGVGSTAVAISSLTRAGPPDPGPMFDAGLDVSYELDLFGRVRRSIRAARADVQAQEAAADAARISVAGETTRAYVNACAYAQELAVARQSLAVVRNTYEVTVKRARDGAASDFDIARSREQLSQAAAALPVYEGQRRTALFQLAVLTGRPPEEISRAADACVAPPKLNSILPIGDIQALFRRRPDVRQAERQLAANVERIGVATAGLYPTINLSASAQTFATSLAGLASTNGLTYGLGPLLSWSFPNSLVARAQIRQARGAASASLANFESVSLQALQDMETALTAYGNELDRHAALAEARAQSERAFDLANIQFQYGRASYLDLLTAQTDLVNTSAALAASDQAVASDQVTVFKALGGGWEQAPPAQALPIHDARTGRDIPVH